MTRPVDTFQDAHAAFRAACAAARADFDADYADVVAAYNAKYHAAEVALAANNAAPSNRKGHPTDTTPTAYNAANDALSMALLVGAGIDPTKVVAVAYRHRVGEPPTLTVERYITDTTKGDLIGEANATHLTTHEWRQIEPRP